MSSPVPYLLVCCALFTGVASAAPGSVRAVRLTSSVNVDGVLDEAVWQIDPAVTEFKQRDPVEGATPSQRTEVRLAFDDDALYVGARMLGQPARFDPRAPHAPRRIDSRRPFFGLPRSLSRPAQWLLLPRQRRGHAVRRHALERRLGRRLLGRRVGGKGEGRRQGMDGGIADPVLAAPLPAERPVRVGHQLPPRDPPQQSRKSTSSTSPRTNPASCRASRSSSGSRTSTPGARSSSCPTSRPKAEFLRHCAERPVQRRLALPARRRRRSAHGASAASSRSTRP